MPRLISKDFISISAKIMRYFKSLEVTLEVGILVGMVGIVGM